MIPHGQYLFILILQRYTCKSFLHPKTEKGVKNKNFKFKIMMHVLYIYVGWYIYRRIFGMNLYLMRSYLIILIRSLRSV